MKAIVQFILKNIPSLGAYKRQALGFIDSYLPINTSYSQHGEDIYLKQQLDRYDLGRGIYVDVGSNHPTRISNTYLLYRQGLKGVAIEPNAELSKLHQKIRPLDLVLSIGCSNKPSLGKLEIGKAPVLSHFQSDTVNDLSSQLGFELWRTEYVPILPLDLVLPNIDYEWIFLLSIDVEGLDYEVLEGSVDILKDVFYCCVEANSDLAAQQIDLLMSANGFEQEQVMGCNLIYRNTNSRFTKYAITSPSNPQC